MVFRFRYVHLRSRLRRFSLAFLALLEQIFTLTLLPRAFCLILAADIGLFLDFDEMREELHNLSLPKLLLPYLWVFGV